MKEVPSTNQQLQDLLSRISATGTVASNSEKDIGVVDRMMISLYGKSSENRRDQLNDIRQSIADPNTFARISKGASDSVVANKWAIEHAVHATYLSEPTGEWPVNQATCAANIVGSQYTPNDVVNIRSLLSALNSAIPAKFSEAVCATLGSTTVTTNMGTEEHTAGRIENGVQYYDETEIATFKVDDALKLRAVLNGLDSINGLSSLAADVVGTWSSMTVNDMTALLNMFSNDAAHLQLIKDLLVQQNLLMILCRLINNMSNAAALVRQTAGNVQQTAQQSTAVQPQSLNDTINLINYIAVNQLGWVGTQPQCVQLLQLLTADELQALTNILAGYNIQNEIRRISDRHVLNAIMLALNADVATSGINVTAVEMAIISAAIARSTLTQDVINVLNANPFLNWLVYNINSQIDLATAMRADITRGTQIMTILYGIVYGDNIAEYIGTASIPSIMMNLNAVISGYQNSQTSYSGSYPSKDAHSVLRYLQTLTIGLNTRADVINSNQAITLAAVLAELMQW